MERHLICGQRSRVGDVDRASLMMRNDGHIDHLSGGNPGFPILYKEGFGRSISNKTIKTYRIVLDSSPISLIKISPSLESSDFGT